MAIEAIALFDDLSGLFEKVRRRLIIHIFRTFIEQTKIRSYGKKDSFIT